MNIGPTPVYHAANLSMFMINLSQILRQQAPFLGRSVIDFQVWFQADKYVREVLKLLQQSAEPNFINRIIADTAQFSRVNRPVEVV